MSNVDYVPDLTTKISLKPSRQAIKRAALALALALGVAAAGDFGYDYLTTGRYLETTDDAYVKADSTIVAPKVSGYIAEVLVSDNEKVAAGQLLARIDDRDFRTALAQAKADVAASDAAVRNLDAQIELQQPIIQQQAAEVDAAEANLQFAQEERARYDVLMKSGSGTVQRAQQTDAALRAQTAQLQQGKAGLAAANKRIEVLATDRAKAVAQLDHARAVEAQAALNLSYTGITAPVDGSVGARSLRVGQFVQAGTQLMAVVPLDAVYVVANFKETQLTNVRNGQQVEIRIDPRWSYQKPAAFEWISDKSVRATAISICLVGDFDQSAPSEMQVRRLEQLVQTLQRRLAIPDKNVIAYDRQSSASGLGRLFPAGRLRQTLLP